ncbi:uncharacterized protein LOC128330639 isoform X2 [Hemicordylus capensis]|uniref:uncharacterized protein LOC128330639 isoform X2 n=1 Tax=Hemicordylus capensis TaxID=884348 RepID=UPI002304349C|nr:uncharacterized protein LOC128330639 isoform X2 [Hemicordylus capensis]
MEGSSESLKEDPQSEKAAQTGFAPRMSEAMAEFLVNTVAGTAKMVQASVEAQKSAQLACFHAEQSLSQARLSYVAARGLAERLLGFLNPPDYQGLFQHMSQPPIPYSEFCSIIRRAENALLHPVLKCMPGFPARRDVSPSSECRPCRPPDNPEDGLQGEFLDFQCLRSPCLCETDEEGTDEEENRSLPIRGRNPSRHKQVETVLLEDQMGGSYVTHRRRSPRRSPSAGVEGLSPLVSEQDLNTIQPLICCPSRQGGSGKFVSKVTWRKEQPQRENSDSDTDHSEISAKDTG